MDETDTVGATRELSAVPFETFEGSGGATSGASEVVAHSGGRLFVTNGDLGAIDVFDLASQSLLASIEAAEIVEDLAEGDFPGVGGIQSVDANADYIVAALDTLAESDGSRAPGVVLVIDAPAFFADGTLNAEVIEVGFLPDSVKLAPSGGLLAVANEGQFNAESEDDDGVTVDSPGSLTLLDLGSLGGTLQGASFVFGAEEEALALANGLRLHPDAEDGLGLEPEFASFSPDGDLLYVTLQENNGLAVFSGIGEIELPTYDTAADNDLFSVDLLSTGVVDHLTGFYELQTFDFGELPPLGTDANGLEIPTGGFSGLHAGGGSLEDDTLVFQTVPDRGPNGADVTEGGTTFNLPDLQASLQEFSVDLETGVITLGGNPGFVDGNGTPITGRPNIPGFDQTPVDAAGNPLPYDPLGADMEGIVFSGGGTGNFRAWTVDEYRPAIYEFSVNAGPGQPVTYQLENRYVPEGTSLLGDAPQAEGFYGEETLPEEYGNRRTNRGFEAIALDEEAGVVYAFIQTPLANPDRDASDSSRLIRILGIDAEDGTPVAEYAYILEDPSSAIRAGGRVDKIGDAIWLGDGRMAVIERDANFGRVADKNVFEIDITQATNLIANPPNLPADTTLEQLSVRELFDLGIEPVTKRKLFGLPEVGYTPSDKPEGLTVLDDGTFAVLNDNDFGITEVDGVDVLSGVMPQLGLLSGDGGAGLDATDDGMIDIAPRDVWGMRMADAVTVFEVNGQTFVATANEGDGRGDGIDGDGAPVFYGDEARVGDLSAAGLLDPSVDTTGLDRLVVSTIDGDTDGDGDIDQLHSFGSRSFTIFDTAGTVVFDSGSEFERIIAEIAPERFNDDEGGPDENRSDNKGPEPEAIAFGEVEGRPYLFIGAERDSGVFVYNVADPFEAKFVTYIDGFAGGNVAPETIAFIPAEDSPSGTAQIAVAYEESGTTAVFELDLSATVLTTEAFYAIALGRQFDTPGLNFWTDVLALASTAFLAEAFDLSTEFQASVAGLTDAEGIDLVIGNALDRDATAEEIAAFEPVVAESGYDQLFLALLNEEIA